MPKISTVTEICAEFRTDMGKLPPIELISHEKDGCKHSDIIASKSKLFFIKYTPDHTLCQCWYLVQVVFKTILKTNK